MLCAQANGRCEKWQLLPHRTSTCYNSFTIIENYKGKYVCEDGNSGIRGIDLCPDSRSLIVSWRKRSVHLHHKETKLFSYQANLNGDFPVHDNHPLSQTKISKNYDILVLTPYFLMCKETPWRSGLAQRQVPLQTSALTWIQVLKSDSPKWR